MQSADPESIADIVSACQANSSAICQAFSQAFEVELALSVGLGTNWDETTRLEGFDGPGLIIVVAFDRTALAAVLPESSGLLPRWCAQSDPASQGKLEELAQELSMFMAPSSLAVSNARAVWVASLSEALHATSPASDAARVPLVFRVGKEQRGTLSLIWSVRTPDRLASGSAASAPRATPKVASGLDSAYSIQSTDDLPKFTRSLLRVRLPVSVRLAAKKEPAQQILELGIGSIIHFDKPCDDPLQLEVNGRPVAQGEAVKVGDKFGIRIQSVLLPDERFEPLRRG